MDLYIKLGLICGLAFLAWGLIISWTNVRFLLGSQATTGKVLKYRQKNVRRVLRYPVVAFKLPSGERQEFESTFGRNREKYRIGAKVPVRYLPGEPEQARIDAPFEHWFDASLFLALGGVLTVLCW